MTLLYNSIRGLVIVASITIAMLFINREIADVFFFVFLIIMAIIGLSLILLVMKNNKPNSASDAYNTPYYAQNRHDNGECVPIREEITKTKNDGSYTNSINANNKGSHNSKKCFISFHDIFLPPSMILIVKRIISRGIFRNNQMQIKPVLKVFEHQC